MKRVHRDIERCRQFLKRHPSGQPAKRIREVMEGVQLVRSSPKRDPVGRSDPTTGLDFRRRNVAQFAIVYVYFEPAQSIPSGMVSIRAIRHASEEDVFWGVRDHCVAGTTDSERTFLSTRDSPDAARSFTDEDYFACGGPDLIHDDDIDYAEIATAAQPDQPGGRIVFDSDDYATEEEAMAALEALIAKAWEGLHDGTVGTSQAHRDGRRDISEDGT